MLGWYPKDGRREEERKKSRRKVQFEHKSTMSP
jgi:hypothetical protein